LFHPVALQPNEDHGFLILEVSRSHTTTQHSWYDCGESQIPLPVNIHTPPEGFEPATPSYRAAADPTLTGRDVKYYLNVVFQVCYVINDWLRAGRSGDRIPVGARFSATSQTGPGAHPASCKMGTGSFPGVKNGRGVMLTPHPLLVPLVMKE
jgi:hypothetical protein